MLSVVKKTGLIATAIGAIISLVVLVVNVGPFDVSWKFLRSAEASRFADAKEMKEADKAILDRVSAIEKELAEHRARENDLYAWTKEIHMWVARQDRERKR